MSNEAQGDHAVIVVIDDDHAMRLACEQILTRTGHRVETFHDGASGLEGVARLRPDLVVVDLKMPGLSGLEVIERLQDLAPEAVVVVITGYATIDTAVEAMRAGAYDFLPKPFSPEELRLITRRGLERRRLVLEAHQADVERELLRRRFITFVSHQLKTPLVAIHQYLDVLRRLEGTPDVEAKRRDWLDRCLARATEMRAIIEDWLAPTQIERGTLVRQRVEVDLKPIVLEILRGYEGMAAERNVTLAAELPDPAYVVQGDRNCLSVLFDNLIVNAIRYNRPNGSVQVVGTVADGIVSIAVIDSGIGIPAKYVPMLFDEFFRVPKGGDKVSGTGLGLPICRRIATELGAAIDVESEEGVGSTFRVRMSPPPADDDARLPDAEH